MALLAHDCVNGWLENEDGTVRKCPDCHPHLQVAHARKSDPLESHLAAASVKVSVSEDFVLGCLRDIGKAVSDEELLAYVRQTYPDYKIADSRVRTARCKLVDKHLVRWGGRGRTSRDKACNIWEAV